MTKRPLTISRIGELAEVIPSIFRAIGIDDTSPEPSRSGHFEFPQARRACVVLVDGLGYHQLAQRLGHAPTIRSIGLGDPIVTVVPSTTVAGISAFGTGCLPGRTHMAGYALRVPQTNDIFNLIAWNHPQVDPVAWQPVPSFFERCEAGDLRRVDEDKPISLVKIQPKKYVNSGLTNAALRGGQTVVAQDLSQRVDAALAQLRGGADIVYLYWGDLDSTGHKHGWQSESWTAQLEHFDAELRRLRRMLPAQTLLIVTADHGMIDAREAINIAQYRELKADVDVVAGESRAVHLYSACPDEVAQHYRDVLEDRAWIYTADEAISCGLFGEVTPQLRQVIGDVLVFAREDYVVVDSRVQSPSAMSLIGVHGSLTPAEMEIPLLVDLR
ncbi:alkaline phosphatase family protein [Trueperella sp. LYQ143]|uniref:alkaline phosphatase family protein n=1 Tax=Trueperella sp. LYQ143 TaxID=3391059 RepID=UPI0039839173